MEKAILLIAAMGMGIIPLIVVPMLLRTALDKFGGIGSKMGGSLRGKVKAGMDHRPKAVRDLGQSLGRVRAARQQREIRRKATRGIGGVEGALIGAVGGKNALDFANAKVDSDRQKIEAEDRAVARASISNFGRDETRAIGANSVTGTDKEMAAFEQLIAMKDTAGLEMFIKNADKATIPKLRQMIVDNMPKIKEHSAHLADSTLLDRMGSENAAPITDADFDTAANGAATATSAELMTTQSDATLSRMQANPITAAKAQEIYSNETLRARLGSNQNAMYSVSQGAQLTRIPSDKNPKLYSVNVPVNNPSSQNSPSGIVIADKNYHPSKDPNRF